MSAIVCEVVRVDDHPNPEKSHLGCFTLSNDALCIGVNNGESRRFIVGDLVVHISPGSIIPEWLIKEGFQNLVKTKGKVKAEKLSSVVSEGIMLDVIRVKGMGYTDGGRLVNQGIYGPKGSDFKYVAMDDDVTEFLGVK